MDTPKVWFVTGASKGFGLEICRAALLAGDKVVATVRSQPERLFAELNQHRDLFIVQMDVTDEKQVKRSVKESIDKFGQLDVVVNNAGYGIVTSIEEASDEEVRQQYDTNVFGLLNVTRAVLPFLRKQRSGHIINTSSLFAFDVIPGWALYASTKFAVEGISKGLAKELDPFGIKVTAIEPGLFRTEFTSKDSYRLAKNVIDDYSETMVGYMRNGTDSYHGTQPGDPKKLADVVVKLAHMAHPPLHLPIGNDSLENYWNNAEKTGREIKAHETVSRSTDIDEG
jgi:NAD(P)-dependent dehydrogenase (short-subunit alcohol dehydrogenase family)